MQAHNAARGCVRHAQGAPCAAAGCDTAIAGDAKGRPRTHDTSRRFTKADVTTLSHSPRLPTTLLAPSPPAYAGLRPLDAPVFLRGPVVHGFGRGSKQLGIPTANLDALALGSLVDGLPAGIYFGWASVGSSPEVYKMVMSIGWCVRRRREDSGSGAAGRVAGEAYGTGLRSFGRPTTHTPPRAPPLPCRAGTRTTRTSAGPSSRTCCTCLSATFTTRSCGWW